MATRQQDFRDTIRQLRLTPAALDPAGWARSATFTGTTPGWMPTVFDVASGIARHEHSRFDQIGAAHAPRGRNRPS